MNALKNQYHSLLIEYVLDNPLINFCIDNILRSFIDF